MTRYFQSLVSVEYSLELLGGSLFGLSSNKRRQRNIRERSLKVLCTLNYIFCCHFFLLSALFDVLLYTYLIKKVLAA